MNKICGRNIQYDKKKGNINNYLPMELEQINNYVWNELYNNREDIKKGTIKDIVKDVIGFIFNDGLEPPTI